MYKDWIGKKREKQNTIALKKEAEIFFEKVKTFTRINSPEFQTTKGRSVCST